MAIPGALPDQLTRDGLERSAYDRLEVVGLWRSFLDEPQRFLRHLG